MKSLTLSLAVSVSLLTNPAHAADSYGPAIQTIDSSPRIVLYVHKYVGAGHRKLAAPTFGLGLERQVSIQTGGNPFSMQAPTMRLLDFRITAFQRHSFRINGINFSAKGSKRHNFGSYSDGSYGGGSYGDGDGEDSYGEDNGSWSSPWLWVATAIGAFGISCATGNFPCESNSNGNDGQPTPYRPTGP